MRRCVVAAICLALVGTGCAQPTAPYVSEQFSARHRSGTTAYTETVLHRFTGRPDGEIPLGGVVLDTAGNIFGTTSLGGAYPDCPYAYGFGCGTVFTIAGGKERVVYSFRGRPDGSEPRAGLLLRKGVFYGTTSSGGDYSPCFSYGALGCGTIFKIDRNGAESLLYNFEGNNTSIGGGKLDGLAPMAGLVADADGNLYGTTPFGGKYNNGTIFEFSKNGTESVLYSFQDGNDGARPYSGVIRDRAGNLYGVAYFGGLSSPCTGGCGTIFELSHGGSLTVLYSFTGKSDGGNPIGGMVMDHAGNLYGTAQNYGNVSCNKRGGNPGCGTVFKFTTQHKLKVLHVFGGDPDGAVPSENLIIDAKGNLYGSTSFGGDNSCNSGAACGTVFEVDVHGHESILHTFKGGKNDGEVPYGPVNRDEAGNLYGTTVSGGVGPCNRGCGIVFKLTP